MNYKDLANEFLNATFELNKQGPQRRVDESLKGERFVMYYLYINNQRGLPSKISDKMGISTARVAVILNRLEDRNLILRTIDPKDRRRILIELTPEGHRLAEAEHKNVVEMVARMLKLLGDYDSQEFVRLIKKIATLSDEIEIPDMNDY